MTRLAPRVFVASAGAVVIAALVLGLVTIGAPGNARKLRFDRMRTEDLMGLADAVNSYVRSHGVVPDTLASAVTEGATIRDHDPQTRAPYEYGVKNKKAYTLCATFALPSSVPDDLPSRGVMVAGFVGGEGVGVRGRWDHSAGRQCFDFSLDTARRE